MHISRKHPILEYSNQAKIYINSIRTKSVFDLLIHFESWIISDILSGIMKIYSLPKYFSTNKDQKLNWLGSWGWIAISQLPEKMRVKLRCFVFTYIFQVVEYLSILSFLVFLSCTTYAVQLCNYLNTE